MKNCARIIPQGMWKDLINVVTRHLEVDRVLLIQGDTDAIRLLVFLVPRRCPCYLAPICNIHTSTHITGLA